MAPEPVGLVWLVVGLVLVGGKTGGWRVGEIARNGRIFSLCEVRTFFWRRVIKKIEDHFGAKEVRKIRHLFGAKKKLIRYLFDKNKNNNATTTITMGIISRVRRRITSIDAGLYASRKRFWCKT